MDFAESGTDPTLRPFDECLRLEEDFWDRGSDDRRLKSYRRLRQLAGEVQFHTEPQDTECEPWTRMLELVDEAAEDRRPVFWPAREFDLEDWARIVELPPSIAKLTSVKALRLYGSHLVRIPSEIGEMSSLEDLDVYTSRRLHWFPYEVTRCRKLRDSRVSTRSLYGNFKYRPPSRRLATSIHSVATHEVGAACVISRCRTATSIWHGSPCPSGRTCCRFSCARARKHASISSLRPPRGTCSIRTPAGCRLSSRRPIDSVRGLLFLLRQSGPPAS